MDGVEGGSGSRARGSRPTLIFFPDALRPRVNRGRAQLTGNANRRAHGVFRPPLPMSSYSRQTQSKAQNEANARALRALVKQTDNKVCADCVSGAKGGAHKTPADYFPPSPPETQWLDHRSRRTAQSYADAISPLQIRDGRRGTLAAFSAFAAPASTEAWARILARVRKAGTGSHLH